MRYNSPKWRQKRQYILRRDKYVCQWCKRYGKLHDATMVHHIFPTEIYPEYEYCDWNLISLCDKAHNMMHDRDTHEITNTGKILQKKVESFRKNFSAPRSPLPSK